jgi:predicted secreted protein
LLKNAKENTMKYLKVYTFALLLVFLLSSCRQTQQFQKQPEEVSIRYSELVESIGLEVGQILEVEFPVDLVSGNRWEVGFYNQAVLEPVGEPEFVIRSSDAGEEELQKLHFRANGKGETELVLLYRQPPGDESGDQTFSLTVNVK